MRRHRLIGFGQLLRCTPTLYIARRMSANYVENYSCKFNYEPGLARPFGPSTARMIGQIWVGCTFILHVDFASNLRADAEGIFQIKFSSPTNAFFHGLFEHGLNAFAFVILIILSRFFTIHCCRCVCSNARHAFHRRDIDV